MDISRVRDMQEPEQQEQKAPEPEPALEPVAAEPQPLALDMDVGVDMPQTDMAFESSELDFEQRYWTQPQTGSGDGEQDYIGEMDTGQREVVPISTARPNIPRTAYDNQINGWVLLAFTVEPSGRVRNIRVMDAEPRGVFEANAIEALQGWIYQPFKGEPKHFSQRIEFDWTNYPYNMDRR